MKLINLISGYERISDTDRASGKRRKKSRFFTRRISGSIASYSENSVTGKINRASKVLFNITSFTRSRYYGAFLLAFGVLTMLLSSGVNLIFVSFPGNTTDFIIGIAASALSLPFFMLDGPMIMAIERNKLLSEAVFDFFCIKRPVKGKSEHGMPLIFCLALGITLAVVGFFTSVPAVVLAFGGAAFAYLSFVSSEFSLFACILILPSVSMLGIQSYITCFAAGIMLLSYLRKVIYGKRSYNFEQYDLIIGLIITAVLISGIFVGGRESLNFALIVICSTSVYFTTGNLITNPRLLDSITKAFVYSSLVPSVTAIVQFAVLWSRNGFVEALNTGVTGTFATSASFACFLIFPICFAFMRARHKGSAPSLLVGLISSLAMLVCGDLFALASLLIALAVHGLIRARKRAVVPVFIFLALPYLAVLFPENSILNFIVGESLSEIHEIWVASWAFIRENILLGVGLSPKTFSEVIGALIPSAPGDAKNMFVDMAVKAGLPTAGLFALLLLSRIFHRISYNRYLGESSVGLQSSGASLAVIAFVVFGTFNQMFIDMSLYYIFFSAFAIGSATLRIACEEHDDRIAYFRDASQSHSAAVDVDLNAFMQH